MKSYQNLFEPVRIGTVEIKNRFAMAPMGPLGLSDSEGAFNQRGIDYYTERARGGTGLLITGVTFVDNTVEKHAMPHVPCSTHNPVHFVRTALEMTERIHAYDTKIFLQMSGGFGRVTVPTNMGEYPPVAPSAIPHRWLDKICRPMTVAEIRHIVTMLGQGAFHAKRAGFDGVEIHAVHEGYLIDQFALTFFNHRTDEYGGSLENRLRFAREVVEEIKKTCGKDFPVALRYSPKSFIKDYKSGALPGEVFEEKGRDIQEGIEAGKLLVGYGYDCLDVDVGSYDSWWWSHPPMYQDKGLYRPFAAIMKASVDVPVICAGRMDNPDMASAAIQDGVCDIIGLGRPLLADPEYVNKLQRGDVRSIRPCISCHEGCMGRVQAYSALNCAVNPQCCRERSAAYNPVLSRKRVLVVGGGVAGCEAARVLAIRGHEPVVYEQSARLGGNLIPAGAPDFKEDEIDLADWFAHQLATLKVDVHLHARVDKAFILSNRFDAVIIATGANPRRLNLGDPETVHTAADVLVNKADPGQRVVVVGGGLIGCETALWLARQGRDVTVVEVLDKLLAVNGPLCHANSDMLIQLLPYNGVTVKTSTSVKSYADGRLVCRTDHGDEVIDCDSLVLAVGYDPDRSLYDGIRFEVPQVYVLGDARKVANIMYAIWDAFEVANGI
ncbi:MAG: FAD-dependent oxidoreductase [Pseudomonadota bacterium]